MNKATCFYQVETKTGGDDYGGMFQNKKKRGANTGNQLTTNNQIAYTNAIPSLRPNFSRIFLLRIFK